MDKVAENKKKNFLEHFLNIKALLIFGAFVHLTSTLTIYLVGRFRIFPSWIFEKGTLREDATKYIGKIEVLNQKLLQGDFSPLFSLSEQIHTYIFAVSHFLTSGIFGSNILSFELINLPLFLCVLFLIYKIGELLFSKKAGIISAYSLFLFPSIILHSTQPLRDTFFVAIFLLLLFQILTLIRKPIKVSAILTHTLLIGLTFTSLWFIRDRMILIYLGIILISILLLFIKNLKNKWSYKFNLATIFILLILGVLIPTTFSNYLPKRAGIDDPEKEQKIIEFAKKQTEKGNPSMLARINTIRYSFSLVYENAGSNIDSGYIFENTFDLIKYLPRAISIGLLSPFPNTWLGEGVEFGKAGRILAGGETFIMYVFMFFSLFAIYKHLNFRIFLVVATILIGVTALGLTITNVGGIYRLRYIFWVLLIILGTKGLLVASEYIFKRVKTKSVEV